MQLTSSLLPGGEEENAGQSVHVLSLVAAMRPEYLPAAQSSQSPVVCMRIASYVSNKAMMTPMNEDVGRSGNARQCGSHEHQERDCECGASCQRVEGSVVCVCVCVCLSGACVRACNVLAYCMCVLHHIRTVVVFLFLFYRDPRGDSALARRLDVKPKV